MRPTVALSYRRGCRYDSGIEADVIRYDDSAARRIGALSCTPEMREQRQRVIELLAPQPGERLLDVGCGTGHLARELAAIVSPGGQVRGVDISNEMLVIARQAGVDAYHATGTSLPFADAEFDAAVATQVYEFVEDLPSALVELRRVLRPGGRVVILDTDWDSIVWHASDARLMERVLDGWRARTANPHLPRTLAQDLRATGFEVTGCATFAILDTKGEDGSYSTQQIEHLGASVVGVSAMDIAAWAADLHALAQADEYFFSINRYLFLANNPGATHR